VPVRIRPHTVVLAGTLVAAAATRLTWLNLMEFKGDEANACRLALHVLGYSEPGVGRFFPTAGLVSSVSVPNPPLFVYLVALPLAFVRSPIAPAALVAAANVLAVWLTYVAGKRCFSRFVGLTAAALLAVSPWGIVFSRKIWAQDLLPVCTTLFILQLHALLVRRQPRAVFGLFVITALAIQLHFSACVLLVVLGVALIVARRDLEWRWALAGTAVAVALYAPYLAFHVGSILHTAQHHHQYAGPNLGRRLDAAARYTIAIVGGGEMKLLIGKGSTLAGIVSAILGILAPIGLLTATRSRKQGAARLGAVFTVWYVLPLLLLTVLEIHPFIHYFIILLPLPYLGVALIAEQILAWRPSLAMFAIGLTLVCFTVIDVGFFRTIIRDGGAPGDYGIAYRFKQEAVRHILRVTAGRFFLLGADLNFASAKQLRPYRFLIWNARPDALSARGSPQYAFVLVDGFLGQPRLLRLDPNADSYPRATFGPLTLVQPPVNAVRKRR
jgi:hypothetical protein